MSPQTLAARFGRAWFSILVLGSAALVFATFLAFALQGTALSRVLFWIALAGENNVGAWWSGMLLLLASVFAFDGFAAARSRPTERRGWLALAAVLLILSFDEIGSLHEYLAVRGLEYLELLAVPLFVLGAYAFVQLLRARIHPGTLALLLLAFALLGTVPLQEIIQQTREWPDPVIYGLRAALEEGAELVGVLLLVAATSRNTWALRRSGGAPFELAGRRGPVLGVAAVLAPVLVGATFVLPFPGGPADWLAAAVFFGAALLVARRLMLSAETEAETETETETETATATAPLLVLFGWYLVASVGSNAVRLGWDPVVLGTRVGIRGLFFTLLIATAVPILRRAGRPAKPLLFGAVAAVALVGSLWPQAQLLWSGLPILVALHIYSVESGSRRAHQTISVAPSSTVPRRTAPT